MYAPDLRELIEDTLEEAEMNTDYATELLLGTAAVESKLGHHIKQIQGPALGIFQMEPRTEADIWDNYLRYKPTLKSLMKSLGYTTWGEGKLLYDLKYQILMARIHYLRVAEPIPASQMERAKYWKDHYNTKLGKGTLRKYIQAYNQYVGNF